MISGFEPTDMLCAIHKLVEQIAKGKAEVEIQYTRIVKHKGNEKAKGFINQVFIPCDVEWRGLGILPGSGLKISPEYSQFNTLHRFKIVLKESKENPNCICGDVMRGVKTPRDCVLFKKVCCPENPVGACMVSSEGSCGIYYKYGKR